MYAGGAICQRCKLFSEDTDTFTIDHIIPHNMGFRGKWYRKFNNKQLLCNDCQRIKNAIEQSFRKKWNSRKESYIILLNGFATPQEAVEAMQIANKDFNNILLD
jgi:hypothetical protein